uniref:PID domain-containing protein n=1 Tax=Sinocyclocheilus grahami TaxID=75366 RepID=A0A672SQI5_SINGR
ISEPPLRRSASTIESTNHGGPLLTPPTSLNLRSSHNQQLSCDTIKEDVVTVSKETQDSKSRQKYALTNIQNAMGLSQNPTPLNQKEQLDLNKNDRNLVRSSWDYLEGKDNQRNPTIRRRTKSFLEYHREEEAPSSPDKDTQPEEKRLLPKLEAQMWAKENHVEAHLTLPQNHLGSSPGRVRPQMSPLHLKLRGDEPEESPEKQEEDSSWTTLSQESPSVETPQETGDQQKYTLFCSPELRLFDQKYCKNGEILLVFRIAVFCVNMCSNVMYVYGDVVFLLSVCFRCDSELTLQVFPVQYLGWLEVRDVDVKSGKSGAVLSDCIQQLVSLLLIQTQTMLLVLQNVTLTLIHPADHTLLHSQPISCIRVWGVGRGFSRFGTRLH